VKSFMKTETRFTLMFVLLLLCYVNNERQLDNNICKADGMDIDTNTSTNTSQEKCFNNNDQYELYVSSKGDLVSNQFNNQFFYHFVNQVSNQVTNQLSHYFNESFNHLSHYFNESFNHFKNDINESFNHFKNDVNERLDQFNERLDQFNESFNQFKNEVNERLDQLNNSIHKLSGDYARTSSFLHSAQITVLSINKTQFNSCFMNYYRYQNCSSSISLQHYSSSFSINFSDPCEYNALLQCNIPKFYTILQEGTGSIINVDGNLFFVTNRHIVLNDFTVNIFRNITLFDGTTLFLEPRVQFFTIENAPDIAIVPVDTYPYNIKGYNIQNITGVNVSKSYDILGQHLYGYSKRDSSLVYLDCYTVEQDLENIFNVNTNCGGSPGFSGTGYYDSNGFLYAIHVGPGKYLNESLIKNQESISFEKTNEENSEKLVDSLINYAVEINLVNKKVNKKVNKIKNNISTANNQLAISQVGKKDKLYKAFNQSIPVVQQLVKNFEDHMKQFSRNPRTLVVKAEYIKALYYNKTNYTIELSTKSPYSLDKNITIPNNYWRRYI